MMNVDGNSICRGDTEGDAVNKPFAVRIVCFGLDKESPSILLIVIKYLFEFLES